MNGNTGDVDDLGDTLLDKKMEVSDWDQERLLGCEPWSLRRIEPFWKIEFEKIKI